jgi:two-component system chemotaxis response regulator CheB
MKLRVLVVDDSLFMRAAIRKLIEKEPRLTVVGEAKDGRDAVDKVLALRPDVCTMDFNMPRLDGVQAVREIMRLLPTPVVMLSAHTREGARETLLALEAGAVDFVAKPTGEVSAELAGVAAELTAKLIAAAEAAPQAGAAVSTRASPPSLAELPRVTRPMPVASLGPRVAVIGISTGGPAALTRLLPELPADCPLAIVVVQHLPAGFTGPLAERLDGLCSVRVREAVDGDRLEAGLVLIAPGDRHLELSPDQLVRVHDGPEVHGVRPSADVTMRSAARVLGRRAIALVMTGMGKDGADGLRAIKEAGGATLVQDQASSVIYGMPRAALATGCADRVVPLDQLADALCRS